MPLRNQIGWLAAVALAAQTATAVPAPKPAAPKPAAANAAPAKAAAANAAPAKAAAANAAPAKAAPAAPAKGEKAAAAPAKGEKGAAPAKGEKGAAAPAKVESGDEAVATTKAPPEDPKVLRGELRSGTEARAAEAARRLAEDPSAQATEVILDELSVGAPPKVQAELLAGLAGRKDPRAFDVLALYASNRNPALRKKAVVALADIAEPRVAPLLIAALSDGVYEVRAAGARALMARSDRSPAAEEALVKLLLHKDEVAVDALGLLGGPSTARRLGELFGQVPDGLIAGTFAEMLRRADFGPDPIRVEVVKALGKLPGPEATVTLRDYITATETEKTRPSRLEAQKLIEQRGAR